MPWDNARFLIFIHGSDVKVTLKPGQTLIWFTAERTEEGWTSESHEYELQDGMVRRIMFFDGRDCDGRMTQTYKDYCPVSQLHDHEFTDDRGMTTLYPAWQKVSARQRDYTAESMGY